MSRTPLVKTKDHRYAAENLCAYLDGELTTSEAQRVSKHVTACAECQRELAQLRATAALLRRTPARPLPRSCTLPLSVQSQQASQSRWNTTFSFMRGGMVAVTALLLLSLSVDTVFRAGLVRLPSQAPAATAKEYGLAATPTEAVAETQVVEKALEREAGASAPSEPVAEAEAVADGEAVAALAAPAPDLTPEGEVASETSPAVPTFKQGASPQPGDVVGAGAPQLGAQEAPTAEASVTDDVAETQTEALALPIVGAEPPVAIAAAPVDSVALPEPELAAAVAQPVVEPQGRGSAWVVWETARTLLGVLLGLLLVLAAGLLWAGHKRRA